MTDFAPEDKIAISGFDIGNLQDLLSNALQSSDDTIITFDDSTSLTLRNVALDDLGADDFKFAL